MSLNGMDGFNIQDYPGEIISFRIARVGSTISWYYNTTNLIATRTDNEAYTLFIFTVNQWTGNNTIWDVDLISIEKDNSEFRPLGGISGCEVAVQDYTARYNFETNLITDASGGYNLDLATNHGVHLYEDPDRGSTAIGFKHHISGMPELSGESTLCAWVKLASTAGHMFNNDDVQSASIFGFSTDLNTVFHGYFANTSQATGEVAPQSEWLFVAWTRDNTNDCFFHWVYPANGGTLQTMDYTNNTSLGTTPGWLGRELTTSGYDGQFSDVRVYSRALTLAELQQIHDTSADIYTNLPDVVTNDYIARYTFKTDLITDETGNYNLESGTNTGVTLFTDGDRGQVAYMDRHHIHGMPEVGGASTLICWAYVFSTSQGQMFNNDDVQSASIFGVSGTDNVIKGYAGNSGDVVATTPLNQWIFMCWVREPNSLDNLYYYCYPANSGVVQRHDFISNTTNGTTPGWMGREQVNAGFEGYFDDVRVYDRALGPREIQAIYNETKDGQVYVYEKAAPQPGPVLYVYEKAGAQP
jgi:hypothetical protein